MRSQLRAVLIPLNDEQPNLGELIKLRRDSTIIGRSKGDVVVEDREISSSHCQFQVQGSDVLIFDMNSTNGTFVNGQRVLKQKLEEGDKIQIGRTCYLFSYRDEAHVENISTVFRALHPEKKTGSSIVETLIENDTREQGPKKIVLRVIYRDGNRETIEVEQRNLYIGRASSFGHFDRDTELSRKHVLVKINEQGDVFVEDQGSTNGTYINGERLRGMRPISAADIVTIGTTKFQVLGVA